MEIAKANTHERFARRVFRAVDPPPGLPDNFHRSFRIRDRVLGLGPGLWTRNSPTTKARSIVGFTVDASADLSLAPR
jgi:hypothetical protein